MRRHSFASFALSFFTLSVAACASDPPLPPPPPPPPLMSASPTPTPPPATSIDTTTPPPVTPTPPPATVSTSPTNEFSVALYHGAAPKTGNVFMSGASARIALSLATLGAKGQTLDELTHALLIDADPAQNAASAKSEHDAWISAAGKSELVIANRMWLEKTATLDPTFTMEAQTGYGAATGLVDFTHAPEPSRVAINNWVAITTKNKIQNLLPQGSITSLTHVVLTNAIYFKGNWQTAFPKSATADAQFHGDAGATNVKMMHVSSSMSYGETTDARIAQLPYKDSDLAMMVVLPNDASKMDELDRTMSGATVDAWTKSMSLTTLDLAMPKFKIEWSASLKPALAAMGIHIAFTDQADFSGISKTPLSISDVFQKAFVQVDETGTEAAAATGVVVTTRAVMRRTPLVLDHPFFIFIRNQKTGDILFSGRVSNPQM